MPCPLFEVILTITVLFSKSRPSNMEKIKNVIIKVIKNLKLNFKFHKLISNLF
jgi:hypothetical protein